MKLYDNISHFYHWIIIKHDKKINILLLIRYSVLISIMYIVDMSHVNLCKILSLLLLNCQAQVPAPLVLKSLIKPNKKLKIFYLVDNIITLARYPSPLTLRGSWFVLKQSISRCTVRELPSLYLMSKYALTIYLSQGLTMSTASLVNPLVLCYFEV